MLAFKPKNPEVYQTVMKFVKRAIDFLNELQIEGKRILSTIREEPIIDEHGYHGERYLEIPNYFMFIREHEDELRKLKEYITGVETVSRNTLVQGHYHGKISDSSGKIIENPDIRPFVGVEFFISPLMALIEQVQSPRFDEEVFNELYQSIEKRLLYGEGRLYHYYAPLFNFDSKVERLELEGNISIRKISAPMLKSIWYHSRFGGLVPLFQLHEMGYVIEMSHKHPKGQLISEEIPRKTIERVVSALRLFKKGLPGFNVLYHDTGASMPGFAPRDFYGEQYVLETTEAKEFLDFWKLFKKITEPHRLKKRRFLDISIRRFNQALDEHFPEDKLIDFMIAFEALFLRGEKAVSTGQIIAIACSTLLGKNDEEREEIRQFITKAYSIRNCIVHGSEYPKPFVREEYEMAEFVSKIEDYLRDSIKKLLD